MYALEEAKYLKKYEQTFQYFLLIFFISIDDHTTLWPVTDPYFALSEASTFMLCKPKGVIIYWKILNRYTTLFYIK